MGTNRITQLILRYLRLVEDQKDSGQRLGFRYEHELHDVFDQFFDLR